MFWHMRQKHCRVFPLSWDQIAERHTFVCRRGHSSQGAKPYSWFRVPPCRACLLQRHLHFTTSDHVILWQ